MSVLTGMNVQEACEAPRWQHMSPKGLLGLDEDINGFLEVESRVPQAVLEELKGKGHVIRDLGPWGTYCIYLFFRRGA